MNWKNQIAISPALGRHAALLTATTNADGTATPLTAQRPSKFNRSLQVGESITPVCGASANLVARRQGILTLNNQQAPADKSDGPRRAHPSFLCAGLHCFLAATAPLVH